MMSNSEGLSYSPEAKLAEFDMLKKHDDVHFFVEDTDKEYEYEEIFERLFPNHLTFQIYPMGGKPFVEMAYEELKSESVMVFFIADGDFDVALQRPLKQADNFIYLQKYNIESYLLCKSAVLSYMRGRLKKRIKDTERVVDYDGWKQTITPFFKKVFALHCIVQKRCPELPNVSKGAPYFINKDGSPNTANYDRYLKDIQQKLPNIEEHIPSQIQELEHLYGCDVSCFVCGKYLLESLSRYLNTKPVSKKQDYDDLKRNLITLFDITQLSFLRNSIISYIQKHSRIN